MSLSNNIVQDIVSSLKKTLFEDLAKDFSTKFDVDKDTLSLFFDEYIDKKLYEKKPKKKSEYTIFLKKKRKMYEEKLKEEGELEDLDSKEKMKKVSQFVSDRWKSLKKKPEAYQEFQQIAQEENKPKSPKKFNGTYEVEHKGEIQHFTPDELLMFLKDFKMKEIKKLIEDYDIPVSTVGKKSMILEQLQNKLRMIQDNSQFHQDNQDMPPPSNPIQNKTSKDIKGKNKTIPDKVKKEINNKIDEWYQETDDYNEDAMKSIKQDAYEHLLKHKDLYKTNKNEYFEKLYDECNDFYPMHTMDDSGFGEY